MSEVIRLRTRVDIDEEAAVWAWRMDSASVSVAERLAHEAWLKQDPRNARANRELSGVWRVMDGLAEAKHEEKIATFTQPAPMPARRYRGTWATAAAVTLACGALGAFWCNRGSEVQTIATAVGQQRVVTLADGSQVTLNTDTIVDTNLRWQTRDIYLRKDEAHFQVAHDAARPLLVHVGDATVKAAGSAFGVRVEPGQHIDVVVNEGRVEVRASAPLRSPTAATRTVSAGQRLTTSSVDYGITPVSAKRLSSELTWREGALVFDGERLTEAVAEVERYTDTRITISDSASAALPVVGRFRIGDVQQFFGALEAALPVRQTSAGAFIDPR